METLSDNCFSENSVVQRLNKHSAEYGDKTAFVYLANGETEDETLTFSQLQHQVRCIASGLALQGLAGKTALLCYPAGLSFIKAFLACLCSGVVAIPSVALGRRHLGRLQRIAKDAGACALLSDRSSLDHKANGLRPEIFPGMHLLATDELQDKTDTISLNFVSAHMAFLQYTSGSTGQPNGVVISHANLIYNQRMIARAFQTEPDSTMVSWLPHYHDMGLVGNILHPFYQGVPLVFMSPEAFVQNPLRWLQAIAKYRATISGGPNFAYDLCVEKIQDSDKKRLDLSGWKVAFNGSEPVRAATLERFYNSFKNCGFHREAFYPCYGMAEATLFISGGAVMDSPIIRHVDRKALQNNQIAVAVKDSGRALVGCGHSWLDESLLVVNPLTLRICAPGAIGEIWVGGDHIGCGYWNNEKGTAETFHARTACGLGPYLRTGDLGFIEKDQLYVTGRIKDLLVIRGANYYSDDLEATVQSAHVALRPYHGAAFGIDIDGVEQLVVAQEVERRYLRKINPAVVVQAIQHKLAEINLRPHAVLLLKPGQIPVTSSGKVRRSECKRLYLENQWNSIGDEYSRGVEQETKALRMNGALPGDKAIEHFSFLKVLALDMEGQTGMYPAFPKKVIHTLAANGGFGLHAPKQYGGAERSMMETVELLEHLGRIDLNLAMLAGIHHAGSQVLFTYHHEHIPENPLHAVGRGEALCAFALTEKVAGSNPAAMQTHAEWRDGAWWLNGEKTMVGLAQQAEWLTVFAATEQGHSVFVVNRLATGLSVVPVVDTLGMQALGLSTVSFKDVRLEPWALLGEPGQGLRIAYESLKRNRLGVAAMAGGCLHRCIKRMAQYARDRTIASGPLLDHELTLSWLEESIMAYTVIEALVRNLAENYTKIPDEAAMMLKMLASEWLWQGVDRMLQLHGGHGYADQHGAAKLFRDARAMRIVEGPNESLQSYTGLRWQTGALNGYFLNTLPTRFQSQLDNAARRLLRRLKPQNAHIRIAELCAMAMAAGTMDSFKEPWQQRAAAWCAQRFFRLCDAANRRTDADREFVHEYLKHTFDFSPATALGNKPATAITVDRSAVAPIETALIELITPWLQESLSAPVDTLDKDIPLVSYGLDSVMAIELNYLLEKKFQRKLPAQILWSHPSIRALAQYLAEAPVTSPLLGEGAFVPVRETADTLSSPLAPPSATRQHDDSKQADDALAFGLFYFASADRQRYGRQDTYELFLSSARYADEHGFHAVWIPERHFHRFGGLYPNPSVLGAALATQTKRLRLRAGSVVAPLHHPVRIAEEWSVVDNLSGGRVEIGFAGGWNANDFIFAPENYGNRTEVMYDHMRQVQALWRGESQSYVNPAGQAVHIGLFPTPVQKELTVWLTCSGSLERFEQAGACGAHIITALLFQTREELVEKIRSYRKARAEHGFNPATGKVCLMLHTFVSECEQTIRQKVWPPFSRYLKSSVDLWKNQSEKLARLSEENLDLAVEYAFERYYGQNALFGTVDSLLEDTLWYYENGVSELACLIDFGLPDDDVMQGLKYLQRLKQETNARLPRQLAHALRPEGDGDLESALSYGQKALWFLHRLAPHSRQYDILFAVRCRGGLDIERLHTAIALVSARHSLLKTNFCAVNGVPIAKSNSVKAFEFEHVPVYGQDEAHLYHQFRGEKFPAFDLERGALLQVRVYSLADDKHVVLFRAHHIIMDFWSFFLLLQQIEQQYEAGRECSTEIEAGKNYRAFVHAQSLYLQSGSAESDWQYWRKQLGGELEPCALPLDKPRPAVQRYDGDSVPMPFPQALNDQLRVLAKQEATTLYTVLLSAFAVLLRRYSGQTDILLGSPTTGRSGEYRRTIGYFANMIVIRSNLTGIPTFREVLRQNKIIVEEALRHQHYPFPLLVEKLRPKRDPSYSPIFQILFDLMNPRAVDKLIRRGVPDHAGLRFQPLHLPQQEGQFDLALEVLDDDNSLSAYLKYNTHLFDRPTIERMALNFQKLLSNLATRLDEKITQLEILHESEKKAIIVDLRTPLGEFGTLSHWFTHQAARSAESIAVRCGERTLSYRELDQEANRISRLLFGAGFKPGQLVGIYMPRGWRSVVAIVAIIKSGGAYAPLDMQHPAERVRTVCERADLRLALTQTCVALDLPKSVRAIDVDAPAAGHESSSPLVEPHQLAYMIHTSGSTGIAKGAQITHANVCSYFYAMFKQFPLQSGQRWLWFHSICFDFSVWEVWGCLLSGGTLVILPDHELKDTKVLYHRMIEHGVAVFNQTPSAFRQFCMVDERARKRIPCLRHVFFSGEPLVFSQLQTWFRNHGNETRLFNMYGITETSVMSTYYAISPESLVEEKSIIGTPLANTSVYVLDEYGSHVPAGVIGELHIGGPGVGVGYRNDPELTKEKFIADPFRPGAIMYKTGDLGLRLADGRFACVGRNDNQVKVNGYRIELGEIEKHLRRQPGVLQCVAKAWNGSQGDKSIAAYCIGENTLDFREIKDKLAAVLPRYMIPRYLLQLREMPLNQNGKIDRNRLPQPAAAAQAGSVPTLQNPDDSMLLKIKTIWCRVLELDDLPEDQDFFELGGDSVRAVRLVLEVEQACSVNLDLQQFFQAPTVAGQCHVIRKFLYEAENVAEFDEKPFIAVRRHKMKDVAVSAAISMMLRVLLPTWRVNMNGIKETDNAIYAFWHGQGWALLPAVKRLNLSVLASPSRDGRIMANVLKRLGVSVSYGSATKQGAAGLYALIKSMRADTAVALAVDGSRGPVHTVQHGVFELARLSGRPIIPVAGVCSRGWRLKSWDEGVVPKPLSRVAIVSGEPIYVAKHELKFESLAQTLAVCLNRLMELAVV